jgi:hypothetical protein
MMEFAFDRPYSDPERAARKLLVVQDGRIHIEKINAPFCFGSGERRPNIALASSWRSSADGWCCTAVGPM